MREIDALAQFGIRRTTDQLRPIKSGLIHSTNVVLDHDGEPELVLQKINTVVFPDLETLEGNTAIVTARLERAVAERGLDPARLALRFLPAADGRLIATDGDGAAWRVSRYISSSVSVDVAESPELTARIASAFASFQRDLWDVDTSSLGETIPNFHNTPLRCERLKTVAETLSEDDGNILSSRLVDASRELELALDRASNLGRVQAGLADGSLTRSVCHNDTKVNNVLLDRDTMMPLCVIDLDTVGPGSILVDVGDMLRTAAVTASEEERDASKVEVDVPRARAVIDGFLSVLGEHLNELERNMLEYSGWLITMEQAVRYLTDYLEGDVYYGERYPGHNLVRTRNQLALALSMEHAFDLI